MKKLCTAKAIIAMAFIAAVSLPSYSIHAAGTRPTTRPTERSAKKTHHDMKGMKGHHDMNSMMMSCPMMSKDARIKVRDIPGGVRIEIKSSNKEQIKKIRESARHMQAMKKKMAKNKEHGDHK